MGRISHPVDEGSVVLVFLQGGFRTGAEEQIGSVIDAVVVEHVGSGVAGCHVGHGIAIESEFIAVDVDHEVAGSTCPDASCSVEGGHDGMAVSHGKIMLFFVQDICFGLVGIVTLEFFLIDFNLDGFFSLVQ